MSSNIFAPLPKVPCLPPHCFASVQLEFSPISPRVRGESEVSNPMDFTENVVPGLNAYIFPILE